MPCTHGLSAWYIAYSIYFFVDNEVFCTHIRWDAICRSSLTNYLEMLTRRVEQEVNEVLPERFSVIFDRWTKSSVHFVVMCATYPSNTEFVYNKILLAMSLMDDETSQSAQEPQDFSKFILPVHNRRLSNVVALVVDNASTNQAFPRLVRPIFIGCYYHWFNLVVKDFLREHKITINKVQALK